MKWSDSGAIKSIENKNQFKKNKSYNVCFDCVLIIDAFSLSHPNNQCFSSYHIYLQCNILCAVSEIRHTFLLKSFFFVSMKKNAIMKWKTWCSNLLIVQKITTINHNHGYTWYENTRKMCIGWNIYVYSTAQ